MKIKISKTFEKAAKKLHRDQIKLLEDAIDEIARASEQIKFTQLDMGYT